MAVITHTFTAVDVPSRGVLLAGDLAIPERAEGIVLFAHGSGSSRFSPRNRSVAAALGSRRIATLLLDLLTSSEERVDEVTAELRFDVELLAGRLEDAADWLAAERPTRHLALGLFGASTGAAAALLTAARCPDRVRAVVSRGGRPDLAGAALRDVRAPTLLIVGGADPEVLALNRSALRQLGDKGELAVIPGATHLFEEAGALEEVGRLAGDHFARYLRPDL